MAIKFLKKIKILNKRFLPVFVCLILQGCTNWSKNSSVEASPAVTNSTILENEQKIEAIETDEPQIPEVQSNKPLRVTPRRPEIIEEPIIEPSIFVSQFEPSNNLYTVQKGDTLSGIAKHFHISVARLLQENSLKDKNKLSVGQIILIPEISTSVDPSQQAKETGVYTVQKGDTLSHIAAKFGTTIAKLQEENHLKKDTIYIGQKLSIPGIHSSTESPQRVNKTSKSKKLLPIEGEKYVVQKNDNLWLISRRCGISTTELARINNIQNPEKLQVGQVLSIKLGPKGEESSKEKNQLTSNFEKIEGNRKIETQESHANDSKPVHLDEINEEDFNDLFDESKDIPIIPQDEKLKN